MGGGERETERQTGREGKELAKPGKLIYFSFLPNVMVSLLNHGILLVRIYEDIKTVWVQLAVLSDTRQLFTPRGRARHPLRFTAPCLSLKPSPALGSSPGQATHPFPLVPFLLLF